MACAQTGHKYTRHEADGTGAPGFLAMILRYTASSGWIRITSSFRLVLSPNGSSSSLNWMRTSHFLGDEGGHFWSNWFLFPFQAPYGGATTHNFPPSHTVPSPGAPGPSEKAFSAAFVWPVLDCAEVASGQSSVCLAFTPLHTSHQWPFPLSG